MAITAFLRNEVVDGYPTSLSANSTIEAKPLSKDDEEIAIINYSGADVDIHCGSTNGNNYGYNRLIFMQVYKITMTTQQKVGTDPRNIRVWCRIWWDRYYIIFDVYGGKVPIIPVNLWKIYREGIFYFNKKQYNW